MQKRLFLIHGWKGSSRNHWFPYVTLELKADGFDVSAPQMPHADQPKVKEWLSFLKDYVGKPDKDTYFIGHSLGCITIARYLEGLPKRAKVGGCVFVGGFSGRLEVPEVREFYSPQHQTQQKSRCLDNIRFENKASNGQPADDGKVWCGGGLPFDAEKARAHVGQSVMIFSDNDPYVPMEKSLEMAKLLGAKTVLERGKGHFTADSGVTALPSVVSAIRKMSS